MAGEALYGLPWRAGVARLPQALRQRLESAIVRNTKRWVRLPGRRATILDPDMQLLLSAARPHPAHVVDLRIVQSGASQLDHLRRGVHSGHGVGVPNQPTSPQARPARQLQHPPRRPEALQGVLDLGSLGEPPCVRVGAAVVAPTAEPPVLVLAGPLTVVASLFGEQPGQLVGHVPSPGEESDRSILTSHATELAIKHASCTRGKRIAVSSR
jgi:hypothetical protein